MKTRTYKTLLILGLGGCLWGVISTSSADLTFVGNGSEVHGFAVDGRFHADNDVQFDVAIGAPFADTVYVHTDVPASGSFTTASATTFTGASGGEAGWDLHSGRLVGTGISALLGDLMIAAPSEAGGRGKVYVVEGGSMTTDIVEDGWVVFTGEDPGEYAGWSVASGDVNGDGIQDAIIGACKSSASAASGGRVYVDFGPWAKGSTVDLKNADLIINGSAAQGDFGCAVSAGDVNGNGDDEIIVGARNLGGTGSGRVYVIYEAGTGEKDINSISGKVVFKGDDLQEQIGWSVESGEDFNGDGVDDILIGGPDAFCSSPGFSGACPGNSNGRAFLVLGKAATVIPAVTITLSTGDISARADVIFSATNADTHFGEAVSFVRDLNGDGFAEIAVGAPAEHKSYVWYGRTNAGDPSFDASTDVKANAIVDGSSAGLNAGHALADAGDLNGDGHDDLIIGAPGANWIYDDTLGTGEAYVFYGAAYKP